MAFRDMGAGDMFGELAALDGAPRSASVEALEPCLTASMTAEDFSNHLRSEPTIMEALLAHTVAQVRALTMRIFEFSTLAVNNRIHAELLRLIQNARVDGIEAFISRPPTHADMASRISTHREAVTRELNRLTALGLIERHRGMLIVKDIPRLKRMVSEALGE